MKVNEVINVDVDLFLLKVVLPSEAPVKPSFCHGPSLHMQMHKVYVLASEKDAQGVMYLQCKAICRQFRIIWTDDALQFSDKMLRWVEVRVEWQVTHMTFTQETRVPVLVI